MAADNEDRKLIYKVAKAYYDDSLTQQEVARTFHLSRVKVSRLLARARRERLVEITIHPPIETTAQMERELAERFGLKDAIVAMLRDDSRQSVIDAVGHAAAGYLMRTLGGGETVGLTWGTAVLSVVNALQSVRLPDVKVVQLVGGVGPPQANTHGTDLARRMAQAFGARPHLLHAPGVVKSELVRDGLITDPQVSEPLRLAESSDIALVGIGTLLPESTLVQSDCIFTKPEIESLRQLSCVGDIALQFFDADGRKVQTPLDRRIIGLTQDQMRRVGRVVGVAGGMDKLTAIRAALRGRWIHVLVTDERVANALLREAEAERQPRARTPVEQA